MLILCAENIQLSKNPPFLQWEGGKGDGYLLTTTT